MEKNELTYVVPCSCDLTSTLSISFPVSLINGSSVASVEPHLLGIVLVEELNVEEEKAANATSVDFYNQEASTVAYQIDEDVGKLILKPYSVM